MPLATVGLNFILDYQLNPLGEPIPWRRSLLFLPCPFPCHRPRGDNHGRGEHPAGRPEHPRASRCPPWGAPRGDERAPAEPPAVPWVGSPERGRGTGRAPRPRRAALRWTLAPPALGRGVHGCMEVLPGEEAPEAVAGPSSAPSSAGRGGAAGAATGRR